ncbi:GNAT family N-acetyltransferase [Paraclostridium dentum]|uniref:GNAT family N-acetyltransferase n=1 Tax=Paraclostridium dentum TaxID=2662455 RepID=UPI001475F7A1|nr:GNAT family protein [Paraclostridium dentum]
MILGSKVVLRALNRSDMKSVLNWVNNPQIKNLTGSIFPVSEIEHEKWFESKILDPINKIFGIECKETSNMIGIIGLKNVDLISRNAEMYIYIGDLNYWGKGYGTDATDNLIEFCINDMNLHRVYLYVFDYNKRALESYKKSGFKLEGVLRESFYRNGRYHDKLIMSVLEEDIKKDSENTNEIRM